MKTNAARESALSRRATRPAASGKTIEISAEHVAQVSAAAPRISEVADDQIDLSDIPETDFTSPDAVHGKYYAGMQATLGYVLLDPDVRRAFPDAGAVNRVLRSLIEIANNSHGEKNR